MFESFQKAAWEGKDCYCSQGVGAGDKQGRETTMEIIKPGKVRRVKLECPECGCEFACSPVEMVRRYGTVFAKCPQEGCGRSVEVPNGIPEYIEPANHTAIGTITMVLSGATVTEEPVGDDRYITRVTNVSKEAAEFIKALGADTSISLMIDGKYPERFYIGNTGILIAYKAHDGKLYEQE